MKLGVGYRQPLASWISSGPPLLECLEITAEHFYRGGEPILRQLKSRYSLLVHGLGLSLGTPGPLDPEALRLFRRVVDIADPDWISEHVAFTRTAECDLGHLNPICPDKQSLDLMAAHARELSKHCGKPLLLENITSHLRIEGELTETEFLNQLCEKADCGLLLDVTNLFINSRNHQFDPVEWLRQLNPGRIRQLHIVGYAMNNGRYTDDHDASIQQELLDLADHALRWGDVRAVILERDAQIPDAAGMNAELAKLATALTTSREQPTGAA